MLVDHIPPQTQHQQHQPPAAHGTEGDRCRAMRSGSEQQKAHDAATAGPEESCTHHCPLPPHSPQATAAAPRTTDAGEEEAEGSTSARAMPHRQPPPSQERPTACAVADCDDEDADGHDAAAASAQRSAAAVVVVRCALHRHHSSVGAGFCASETSQGCSLLDSERSDTPQQPEEKLQSRSSCAGSVQGSSSGGRAYASAAASVTSSDAASSMSQDDEDPHSSGGMKPTAAAAAAAAGVASATSSDAASAMSQDDADDDGEGGGAASLLHEGCGKPSPAAASSATACAPACLTGHRRRRSDAQDDEQDEGAAREHVPIAAGISSSSKQAAASQKSAREQRTIPLETPAWCAVPPEFAWCPETLRTVRQRDGDRFAVLATPSAPPEAWRAPSHCLQAAPMPLPFTSFSSDPCLSPPPGAVGLRNTGNTCFLNSAVHALSNTPLLRDYFTTDRYAHHVNLSNPLGHRGAVATAFATLLKKIWSGRYASFAPLAFRSSVAAVAPGFASRAQQDAQEFLSCILDALHEDVNRVVDKAYRSGDDGADSLPPRDGPTRAELLGMAEDAWGYHLGRNRSVVTELFHGLLRSQVECETCGQRSVSFDPWMYLQVPVHSDRLSVLIAHVRFVPLDPSLPATRCKFRIKRAGTLAQVTAQLAALRLHSTDGNDTSLVVYLSSAAGAAQFEAIPEDTPMECLVPARAEAVALIVAEHVAFDETPAEEEASCQLQHPQQQDDGDDDDGQAVSENEQILARVDHYSDRTSTGDFTFLRLTREMTNKAFFAAIRATRPDSALARVNVTMDRGVFEIEEDDEEGDIMATLFDAVCARQADPWDGTRTVGQVVGYKTLLFMAVWDRWSRVRPAPDDVHVSVSSVPPLAAGDLTLEQCLRHHNATELLDAQNAWKCPRCAEPRCAFKTLSLWTLPKYLVIHLKKFSFSMHSTRTKVDTHVDYPIRGLDMRPYLDEAIRDTVENAVYDLYAAVLHMGSATMGHYTTVALHRETKQWLLYDDDVVEVIDESSVAQSPAYLLFYERRDSGSPLTAEPHRVEHVDCASFTSSFEETEDEVDDEEADGMAA